MAAGKVLTGYAYPYVALYSVSGTTVSYASGQLLARGVSMSTSIDTSDDNKFYADNVEAENEAGKFVSGTLDLTVDGLKQSAEKLIMGLPTASTSTGLMPYDDDQAIPDVGFGAVARYQSDGVVTYTPVIFPRVSFEQINTEANTQEENIDWQTQSLTATIKRAGDAKHTWKYIGKEETTESAAVAVITGMFNIS